MRIFYLEKTGGYNFLLHQNYAFEIFSDITSCLFSRQIIIHQPCLCAILADPLLGIPKQLCHKNLSNGSVSQNKTTRVVFIFLNSNLQLPQTCWTRCVYLLVVQPGGIVVPTQTMHYYGENPAKVPSILASRT